MYMVNKFSHEYKCFAHASFSSLGSVFASQTKERLQIIIVQCMVTTSRGPDSCSAAICETRAVDTRSFKQPRESADQSARATDKVRTVQECADLSCITSKLIPFFCIRK